MWYKISDIEYSHDFDFFIKNQISVTFTLNFNYEFTSRLEKKLFKTINVAQLSEPEINAPCKAIHLDLLTGKYGKGKLIA